MLLARFHRNTKTPDRCRINLKYRLGPMMNEAPGNALRRVLHRKTAVIVHTEIVPNLNFNKIFPKSHV